MKITVTFDSLEEFQAYMNTGEPAPATQTAQEAPKKPAPKKAPEKVEKTAEEVPAKAEEAPAAEKSDIGETEVKVLLSEKLKAGKKAQVKELFTKYGVEKLSELIEQHPDKLEELYKEAEGI